MTDGSFSDSQPPLEKSFAASLDELYPMLDFICSYAAQLGFKKKELAKIELACEETLVNIISYAYSGNAEEGEIHIHCSSTVPIGIQIEISDKGIPFNPIKHAKKELQQLPIETSSLGGYGVLFILKLMDKVQYKRIRKINRLTLIRYLS